MLQFSGSFCRITQQPIAGSAMFIGRLPIEAIVTLPQHSQNPNPTPASICIYFFDTTLSVGITKAMHTMMH